MPLDDPANFLNRELSWLQFNFRVLAEAEAENQPLLERVKFLAIVSSNLDEFFMVRAALQHRLLDEDIGPSGPDRTPPSEVLSGIAHDAHIMMTRQYDCFDNAVRPALKKGGIHIVRSDDLSETELPYLKQYFDEQVMPALTPLAVDTGHPFPLLSNLATYILFKVRPRDMEGRRFFGQADTVLVQVPAVLGRFIRLPGDKQDRFAVLDDIISLFAEDLLGGYEVRGAYPFRVTRDADFTVDDERTENLMAAIEQELRSRRRGAPVRMEIGEDVPDEIVGYLQEELHLQERDTYRIPSLIDLKTLFGLTGSLDRPDLSDEPWPPQAHPAFRGEHDMFEVIRGGDRILHHPYQSFDPVVEFLDRAADDPQVLAIKITLYRVSGDSPLVQALIRAAESGKQVTALVELRARFDEEANINWARRLDAAGAHVIYGVVGYKTHSKVCLVVRREEDGIQRYVHLSTGNYNDRTARLYTDIGYFTARPEFGQDISAFFNVITGYSLPPKWNRIEMSPTGMRDRILNLIEREIEKHTPETPAFIRAKMNSLIDGKVIVALYRASQAGVRVELVVRGLCRLRPGVPGLSEHITVRSIVDRFLEHPRIFHFHNGGNEEVYCASADWMERNFDGRLELIFPILTPANGRKVLHILDAALEDNVKAWEMKPDGEYVRVKRRKREKAYRSQDVLYRDTVKAIRLAEEENRVQVFKAKTAP